MGCQQKVGIRTEIWIIRKGSRMREPLEGKDGYILSYVTGKMFPLDK